MRHHRLGGLLPRPDPERARVDAMTETMACRGPDAAGVWPRRNAALGHRRLAVIDLPGRPADVGPTPRRRRGDGLQRRGLQLQRAPPGAGREGQTSTPPATPRWCCAATPVGRGRRRAAQRHVRLRDLGHPRPRLVMVRDRMGIKPFYYHRTPDGVLFGSEPKAILANPAVEPRRRTSTGCARCWCVKTPGHAVWKGMQEVPRGRRHRSTANGLREPHLLAAGVKAPHRRRATTVARVRELLDDIVRRQLVADVPAVHPALRRPGLLGPHRPRRWRPQEGRAGPHLRRRLRRPGRELPAQRAASDPRHPVRARGRRARRSDHTDIVLDHDNWPTRRPPRRSAPATCRSARRHGHVPLPAVPRHPARSTVALSGESADEVFGGYR